MKRITLLVILLGLLLLPARAALRDDCDTCREAAYQAADQARRACLDSGQVECAQVGWDAFCLYGVTHCSPCSWIATVCNQH
jgi:hypothetical protein